MSNETANTSFRNHRPTKRLGQNFLKDAGVIKRIIESFSPQAGETVIEVGPGKGALTGELVDSGARVIAIEWRAIERPCVVEIISGCGG